MSKTLGTKTYEVQTGVSWGDRAGGFRFLEASMHVCSLDRADWTMMHLFPTVGRELS